MLGAFLAAYRAIVGQEPPSKSSYVIPCAQSAVETGHWKSMYNYNAGNVTHGGDSYDWDYEYAGSYKFRSYASAQDGVNDMMRVLKKDGVIPFADQNDIPGYIAQLAKTCYVGCIKGSYNPYPAYQKALTSIAANLMTVTPADPPTGTIAYPIESESGVRMVFLAGFLVSVGLVGALFAKNKFSR
jgi:hypothetical protein